MLGPDGAKLVRPMTFHGPARCLPNRFTALVADVSAHEIPERIGPSRVL